MGITVEKLEGKEAVARLVELLSGGTSDRAKKFHEAADKMKAAGFSASAMAAFGEFSAHIEDLASVLAVAIATSDLTKNHDATEFAFAAFKWMEIGLNNCHSMLEKADVDPNLFGLRPRSDGYAEFLRDHRNELRNEMRGRVTYTVTDSHDKTTNLSSVTEGEAAIEALAKLGYTLTGTRK